MLGYYQIRHFGNIVKIRSENDPEMLKQFTKEQLEIRAKWRNRQAKQISENDMKIALEQMKQALMQMAGGTQ